MQTGRAPERQIEKTVRFHDKGYVYPREKKVENSKYLSSTEMEFLRLYGVLRLSLDANLASITIKKQGM